MAWVDNKVLESMKSEMNDLKLENAKIKEGIAKQELTNEQLIQNDMALKKMIDEFKAEKKKPVYYG